MKGIVLADGTEAIVDDQDFRILLGYRWRRQPSETGKTSYAQASIPISRQTIKMHRLIMGLSIGDRRVIDHINGDGLDNRRSNLRICTTSQNCMNSIWNKNPSGFRGVYPQRGNPQCGKWYASICVNRRSIRLGTFNTPEAAAEAYRKAAQEHFGEFLNLDLLTKQK